MTKMNAANAIVNPVERNLEFVLRGCIIVVMQMMMDRSGEGGWESWFCVCVGNGGSRVIFNFSSIFLACWAFKVKVCVRG